MAISQQAFAADLSMNDDGYYEVATAEDLWAFADIVNGYTDDDGNAVAADPDANAILTDDIEDMGTLPSLNGGATNNLGSSYSTSGGGGYAGVFDGDGHSISGITGFDSNYGGFVTYFEDGTLCDLTLSSDEAIDVGDNTSGAFVAFSFGGTIENCVNNISLTSSNMMVGGFIGQLSQTTSRTTYFISCVNNGDIETSSSVGRAGGFIGFADVPTTSIDTLRVSFSACMNTGSVTAARYTGGFVGYNSGECAFEYSCNKGAIETTSASASSSAGGFVGGNDTSTSCQITISNCYNSGSITGYRRTCAGGLVGKASQPLSMSNVLNTGTIYVEDSEDMYAGALVAAYDSEGYITLVENAYWFEDSAGRAYGSESAATPSSGATVVTSEELTTLASSLSAGLTVEYGEGEVSIFFDDADTGAPMLYWEGAMVEYGDLLGRTVTSYREAEYGTPPNGTAADDDDNPAGMHVLMTLTFEGEVVITDEDALLGSLTVLFNNVALDSSYSIESYTVEAEGDTLVYDMLISYAPFYGKVAVSAVDTETNLIEGVTVDGNIARVEGFTTLLDTGLQFEAIEILEGTSDTPASTTFSVTSSAVIRSMNHIIWLTTAGSEDGTGSSIIANSGSYTQSTVAHHHKFWSFTLADSADYIVDGGEDTLATYGYTLVNNGDGTFTITADEAVEGEILWATNYTDSFFNETGIAFAEDVTGVTMPDATGHIWDEDWTWASDHLSASVDLACSVCGETASASATVEVSTTSQSCTQNEATVYTATASYDGFELTDVYEDVTAAATGHSWDEGVVTKEATETEAGEIVYTCTVCGETYTETIPATSTSEDDTDSGGSDGSTDDDADSSGGDGSDGSTDDGSADATVSYSFSDVQDASAYYYGPVYAVAGAGYMTGMSDDVFGVGRSLNRQQMVTILYRVFGDGSYGSTSDPSEYANNATPLTDVADGAYYTAAVNWAYDTGVTTGYTSGANAGTFGVGDKCSFQQFCTFLVRALGQDSAFTDAQAKAVLSDYADGSKVAAYADNSVAYLCSVAYDENGNTVVAGTASGKLKPAASVSRERTATVVYRCMAAGLF